MFICQRRLTGIYPCFPGQVIVLTGDVLEGGRRAGRGVELGDDACESLCLAGVVAPEEFDAARPPDGGL